MVVLVLLLVVGWLVAWLVGWLVGVVVVVVVVDLTELQHHRAKSQTLEFHVARSNMNLKTQASANRACLHN